MPAYVRAKWSEKSTYAVRDKPAAEMLSMYSLGRAKVNPGRTLRMAACCSALAVSVDSTSEKVSTPPGLRTRAACLINLHLSVECNNESIDNTTSNSSAHSSGQPSSKLPATAVNFSANPSSRAAVSAVLFCSGQMLRPVTWQPKRWMRRCAVFPVADPSSNTFDPEVMPPQAATSIRRATKSTVLRLAFLTFDSSPAASPMNRP
mmetsp:Transcript_27972/g.47373  ORF Transcript_27972/g.47373 Transcript_27972/m.47373 type:complete len:205 (-) Transcript_27972:271-885(-)